MTDKQKRAIHFIEQMLEVKYEGTTDKEASAFIGNNLEYAKKCKAFESQISIPVFSSMMGDVEPKLDLDRSLSRELLIRDMQKGKGGLECVTNFARNLIKENAESEE
jgi:hypothetical protein